MNVSREGYIDLSDVRYVEATNYEPLLAGDVLFNNTNSPELVGKTSFIKHNAAWAYSNHMTRVRFYDGTVAPGWVAYSLHYLFLSGYFKLHCTNHVNQASINSGFLAERVQIPLPPAAEQYHIVAEIEKQFSRLDAAVAALKRVQANLRRYRASVLKAACEGRLVPQDPNDEPASELLKRILAERRAKWEEEQLAKMQAAGKEPRDDGWKQKYEEPPGPCMHELTSLPVGWCWSTVAQIGDSGEQAVLTGPFGSNLGREDFVASGVPVLTIGCLTERGLNTEKAFSVSQEKARELERYRVKSGDLLFSRMASVGRADIVPARLSGALINYHLMRLRLAESVIHPALFISFVRGSQAVANYIRDVNHGATRDGINTAQLLNLPVALPPRREQTRIVAEIERRLSVVDEVETIIGANLRRAERLRQSILKRAFEGRLVPQDPNDEPASVLLERIRAERTLTSGKNGRRGQPVQLTLDLDGDHPSPDLSPRGGERVRVRGVPES